METESLSWQSVLIRLGLVFVLILINGFFVTAEFALVGARRTKLREKARQGNRLASLAEKLTHRLDEAVAATQLGITIASLLVGWIGEQTLAVVFMNLLHFLPRPLAVVTSHTIGASLAFALITFMHVVFGELIPKSLGIRYPNRTVLFISEPMRICMLVFKPFVWVLNGSGNFVLRLFGVPPARGHQLVHSVEELKLLIDASHAGGTLDALEKDLLQKIFKFGDLVARQVMVPRTEMASMSSKASLEEVIETSGKTGHTRFPIYENEIDNIVGILHMKDVVHHMHSGAPFQLSRIMKEAHFVPEAMPIVQLLSHLKQKHTQMVIVVDEFGGTSGLVTLEDVIEEIIGDFYDEHHPAVRRIIPVSENELLLDASVRLDEINERFRLNLQSEEADTIGGYVLQELGAIPRVGDKLDALACSIRVEEMSRWRIKRLRLYLQPQPVERE
ncbi:MAG TPA: hemolysin family protein [Acidobacteriota bacterium]|nr:hemolysin family protein [Acidobacteriota bacterium]